MSKTKSLVHQLSSLSMAFWIDGAASGAMIWFLSVVMGVIFKKADMVYFSLWLIGAAAGGAAIAWFHEYQRRQKQEENNREQELILETLSRGEDPNTLLEITDAIRQQAIQKILFFGKSLKETQNIASLRMEKIKQARQELNELTNMMEQLVISIEALSGAAGQLSDASVDISSIADNLAESFQQVNEFVESAIQRNQEAMATTQQKNQAAAGAVQMMMEIKQALDGYAGLIQSMASSSQQIGKSIEIIRGIARQTNLLALNAAIEAARAGDHGHGFAVVADEVRKLAEQSNNSAKEVTGIIKTSISQTHRAMEMSQTEEGKITNIQEVADSSQQALSHLNQVLQVFSKEVTQIRELTVVQSIGVDGVKDKIHDITSLAEEFSATAQQLSATSEEIQMHVSRVRDFIDTI